MTLAFQVIINFFVKEHEVEYSIASENKTYEIKEKYRKDGKDYYDFYVVDEEK